MRIADRSPGGPEGEVVGRMGASIVRSARASSSRMMALTSVALAAAEVPGSQIGAVTLGTEGSVGSCSGSMAVAR